MPQSRMTRSFALSAFDLMVRVPWYTRTMLGVKNTRTNVFCLPLTLMGSTLEGRSQSGVGIEPVGSLRQTCPSSCMKKAVSPACVTSVMLSSLRPAFETLTASVGDVPMGVPVLNWVPKPSEATSVKMNGPSGAGCGPQLTTARMASREQSAMRMTPFLAQAALLVAFAFTFSGCIDERGQFVFGRVIDKCNTEWPICDTIAGCLLGDSSYIEGKFPTKGKIAVQLFEPSTVTMSFLLDNVAGSGTETAINFFEDRCRSRVRVSVEGRTFVGESEQQGVVKRSVDLSGVGDHLIEFTSDARLQFLMKVDVLPLRLKEEMAGAM